MEILADPPRLTVALPTCNGARYIRAALLGLRAQREIAYDLTISDDRSEDETLGIVREEMGDSAIISVNSERLGLAANWNRCVELARTPWVAICHQDDVMRPGHLISHLAAFEADTATGLVASASGVIDDGGREVAPEVVGRGGCGPADLVFAPGEFVKELAVANPLRCSAVTINAEAHDEVGGFDPSYRYVVDWDFWLKVARRRPVAWLARPTVDVRWHLASETHRFKAGIRDLEETSRLLDELYAKDGDLLADPRPLRRSADRRLARAYLNRAYDASKSGHRRLARTCLGRSLRLSPGILGTIARDPRLAARMAASMIPGGGSGE